jgi:hypothetical protein
MTYYVVTPLVVLVVALGPPLWRLLRRKKNLGIAWLAISLALSPIYLFAYSGGV